MKHHENELTFLSLGGAGEIGMNLTLYGYRGEGRMVDWGVTFAEQRQLKNALPSDRERPAVASMAGEAIELMLPRAEADAIGQLARAQGSTPFAVMKVLSSHMPL